MHHTGPLILAHDAAMFTESHPAAGFHDRVLARIPGQKIVTVTAASFTGNFDMTGGDVPEHGRAVLRRLRQLLSRRNTAPFSIVVRQVTDRVDEATGVPWKNVYGFLAADGRVHRIDAEANRAAQCTDCRTGMPLEPEPLVNYV